MSGIKVTNERPARPIPTIESIAGAVDDENVDWEPDTTTGLPPGNDDGDVLTWDGDSWEPEPPAAATREWELWNEGGDPLVKVHGSFGAAETIDPTHGNVHTGTLDADTTVTIMPPAGDAATLLLWLSQDGTGGRDITWSGSVTEIGTPDTTAGLTNIGIATTVDGGSSWVVAWVGGSGSAITIKDQGSDLTATPSSMDFVGAGVVATAVGDDVTVTVSEPTADAHIADTTDAHDASAISIADAGGYYTGTDVEAALQEVAADVASASAVTHVHVAYETHTADGSTTTFVLEQFYEPGSVMAWNRSSGALLGVTEVLPDSATISAAGSAGNLIDFHYAASVI